MPITGDLLTSALAGIAFVGCAMTNASSAPDPQAPSPGRRREAVINGRRVKTVDVHAHCIVPAAAALINHPLEAPGLLMHDTSTRIAAMDAQGIDVEALSINPYWYRSERDVAAELIKLQNETLVEFCASSPDRFVAFATAALQHPELAAEQVEYAVRKLGFRGVGVAGSVAGEELANPRFHPFWAKCEELNVLVFMHPLGTRELEPSGRLDGSGLLTNTIGNQLETTIALSHLIFEGTLDRFPGLKICAAHGGGFLPSYANRSDAVTRCFPDRVG
jgi:aminocarboxymuconate-semialdehyde decarboxylase